MSAPDRRCVRKVTRSGQPCKNRPILGGTVCRMHGGATPSIRRRADERVQLARLRDELGVVDPAGALVDAVTLTRLRVAELEAQLGESPTEALREELGRWIELQAKTAKAQLDAAVAERRQKLAEEQAAAAGLSLSIDEQQAAAFGRAISQIVTVLGHDIKDPKVRAVVHSALVDVAGAVERRSLIQGGSGG